MPADRSHWCTAKVTTSLIFLWYIRILLHCMQLWIELPPFSRHLAVFQFSLNWNIIFVSILLGVHTCKHFNHHEHFHSYFLKLFTVANWLCYSKVWSWAVYTFTCIFYSELSSAGQNEACSYFDALYWCISGMSKIDAQYSSAPMLPWATENILIGLLALSWWSLLKNLAV